MLPDGTLLGRYRTIRLLGEGGFGEVYLAEDTLIQRNVAIKVIKPQQTPNKLQEAIRLFQREMKAIAQLDHPHILPLYDFGEATVNGTKYAFMVMPYCKDGTLETWLNERKDNHIPFPALQDVANILSQAADALQQAHDHPGKILHLDVKPANFLIRQNKENPNCPYLLLADFGIAKFVDTTSGFSTTVRGSLEYMPSEQSRSNPQCASDQYALAIISYKILTYQLPFKGDYAQLLYQHFEVMPAAPSTLNPHIPPEIDVVILKALAKNFQDRYPTITAFADAFKQALVNNADTRVLLSISEAEAQSGVAYPLTLPGGRSITIAVPAGVRDGQSIRQEGIGEPSYAGGPARALIITIAVKPGPDNNREITNHLQNLSQQIRTLSQDVANLQKQIARNTYQPPIIENRRRLLINVQNIGSKLTSKPPSRRAIIVLSILVILIVASSGIFYVYQNQNTNPNQYPSYLPGHGTLALSDPLDGANNNYHWDTTGGCNFSNGAYHATNSNSGTLQNCVAASTNFTNFVFEVTMTINQGDCGGVAFRASNSTTNYYSLQLCTNGIYNLAINTNNTTGNMQNLLNMNASNFNQNSNLIDVLANGSQIAIYINKQLEHSVTDNTFSQGRIGFLAANTVSSTTDVSFTNAKVWTF